MDDVDDLTKILQRRLAAKTFVTDTCWLWMGAINNKGYGRLAVRNGRGGHHVRFAHRAAYMVAHGPIPAGAVVRHKCDNPPCVRPDHLCIGTQAENMRDWAERGRHPKWYPPALRRAIFDRVQAGESIASVARDLDVKYSMAAAVVFRGRHAKR